MSAHVHTDDSVFGAKLGFTIEWVRIIGLHVDSHDLSSSLHAAVTLVAYLSERVHTKSVSRIRCSRKNRTATPRIR